MIADWEDVIATIWRCSRPASEPVKLQLQVTYQTCLQFRFVSVYVRWILGKAADAGWIVSFRIPTSLNNLWRWPPNTSFERTGSQRWTTSCLRSSSPSRQPSACSTAVLETNRAPHPSSWWLEDPCRFYQLPCHCWPASCQRSCC